MVLLSGGSLSINERAIETARRPGSGLHRPSLARRYLTQALEIFERLGTLLEPEKVWARSLGFAYIKYFLPKGRNLGKK